MRAPRSHHPGVSDQGPCCDQCSGSLSPGDVFCGTCGLECDPDKARGFRVRRALVRGDTGVFDFDLVDYLGVPQNLTLTGVKVWFTVKYYLGDQDSQAVAQLTLGAGIATRDVLTSGRIRVTLPASVTQYVKDGTTRLYYDLQILDGTGRITTVEKGLFLVDPDVTRAVS